MADKPFYNVIIKVEPQRFVKYHKVTKFNKLYPWLDKNFPQWTWGNVFFKRRQIGSFTKNKRPERFDI